MTHPLPARPRLRRLNFFPVDGDEVIAVHDPQEFIEPFGLSAQLVPILMFCDGHHTPETMREAIARETGATYATAEILRVLEMMDGWLLFDSPRFAAVRAARDREFITADVRAAAHAGGSYPAHPAELRKRLDDILSLAPDDTPESAAGLVGVIAPHIDLRVGERAYAPVYRTVQRFAEELPRNEPVTFIVLGTSHYGTGGLFVASRKDYATPLGRLQCDREFLSRLEIELGAPLEADDTAHRPEHSIEFQVVFLQHLFGDRAANGTVRFVPILCTSFHRLFDHDAETKAEYESFVRALRKTVAEHKTRTVLLVGGDLAHVGRKFGDPFDAESVLEPVAAADRELLDIVSRCDATGLLAHIAADRDARSVCGFPPMLAFLDTLDVYGETSGEIVHYEQWNERETSSAVTYGSVVYRKVENQTAA